MGGSGQLPTFLASCSTDRSAGRSGESSQQPGSAQGEHSTKTAANAISITSDAFQEGRPIPKKYTEDGDDVSPALSWSKVPSGTKQLALICDDPDAPTPKPWVHWVIYGIASDVQSLPQGVEKSEKVAAPKGALQGKNSWSDGQTIGYRGPAPPQRHGVHHYHFKLYALDTTLSLKPGATKEELEAAMDGHILGTGEAIGTYERK
jgi:Raf kinase inhibitor-like YbhB/YbcL family protein